MSRPRRAPLGERVLERLLGVSRRRRKVAALAIGTGLALLRPALRRVGYTVAVVLAAVFVRAIVIPAVVVG